jgi:outer membrane protein assembly factor BamB
MLTSLAVGVLLSGAPPAAAGWTQWRGPNRDAVSAGEPGPWPTELARRWRIPVGAGHSSPVVLGRTAFVFSREEGTEVARALDLASGRVLWRRAYRAPYQVYPGAASYGSGPRSTPVLHEGRLFTLGIGGILTAFDAASGRIAWQKDFAGRFPAPSPPFGTSMSPLVAGGLLIVHAGGHDGGALIAFDPATGAERWTRAGDGPSYSSPILTTQRGQLQLVIQVHRRILGVEPSSGRVLWSVPFVTPCDQNIVTPLQVGDRLLVSSVDRGTLAIGLRKEGSRWVPQTVWQTQEVSMYMSSPVLANGRVLGLSHRKKGQFFALDPATGAVHWTSAGGQGEHAAFVVAGHSILVLGSDGTLLVLAPDAASFAPSRRYQVAESATYAHPVPTDAGLLIKDEDGIALYARPGPAKAQALSPEAPSAADAR